MFWNELFESFSFKIVDKILRMKQMSRTEKFFLIEINEEMWKLRIRWFFNYINVIETKSKE